MSQQTFKKTVSLLVLLGVVFLLNNSVTVPEVKAQQNNVDILISNDQFVFHPALYSYDIQSFLDKQPGILKSYQFQTADGLSTAREEIEFFAFFYSINPQVILTILETQDQLLSNPTPSAETITPRNITDKGGTFSERVRRTVEDLYSAYYLSLNNDGLVEFSATRAVLTTLTGRVILTLGTRPITN